MKNWKETFIVLIIFALIIISFIGADALYLKLLLWLAGGC